MIPQTNPNSWRAPESIAVGVAGAVVAGVIFLLGEPVSSDQAVDAAAVVTRVWRSSVADRNMVSYRFTAEHRNWSGEASVPLGIWTKLRSGAPLRIRYAPGWPSLNHPVGWPSPRSFDWPLPLRLEPDTREALQRWADADLRSLDQQIEFLLRRALVESGRLEPSTEEPFMESTQ